MKCLFSSALIICAVLCLGCEDSLLNDGIYQIREEGAIDAIPADTVDGSEVITGDEAKQVVVNADFWISDTGVVHNSLCRWYQNCAGKVWDNVSEHQNCQTCGGTEPIIRKWNLPNNQ